MVRKYYFNKFERAAGIGKWEFLLKYNSFKSISTYPCIYIYKSV
jgi:hypothetical protein